MVEEETPAARVRSLTRRQRRVLGTLVEKAFTTPEYYPLTLKAVTSGANQKSNRSPVSNYSEDQLQETLEELQALGLSATVHTESGRTERFRHYVRKVYDWTEPQVAIMTELWLRGRQQLGELRTRASRMVPIESQEALRSELQGLLEGQFIQASGALDRRGVEVDHNFYLEGESMSLSTQSESSEQSSAGDRSESTARGSDATDYSTRLLSIEQQLENQQVENQQLRELVESLHKELQTHQEKMEQLRRDLGT